VLCVLIASVLERMPTLRMCTASSGACSLLSAGGASMFCQHPDMHHVCQSRWPAHRQQSRRRRRWVQGQGQGQAPTRGPRAGEMA
jgi:hypothetical protein